MDATTTHPRQRPAKSRKAPEKQKLKPITDTPIAEFFKDEEHTKALLADSRQLDAVANKLSEYAKIDHDSAGAQKGYGEVLYNILKLPIEAQKPIVWAIADRNNVVRPDYPEGPKSRGRQPSGRRQLAEAQYGMWPDMLTLEGKNKDTRAGMRITFHVHQYKQEAGLMEERQTRAAGDVPVRTLKRSFEALVKVAKSDNETKLLLKLFERLGIDRANLEEWEAEAVQAPAA